MSHSKHLIEDLARFHSIYPDGSHLFNFIHMPEKNHSVNMLSINVFKKKAKLTTTPFNNSSAHYEINKYRRICKCLRCTRTSKWLLKNLFCMWTNVLCALELTRHNTEKRHSARTEWTFHMINGKYEEVPNTKMRCCRSNLFDSHTHSIGHHFSTYYFFVCYSTVSVESIACE